MSVFSHALSIRGGLEPCSQPVTLFIRAFEVFAGAGVYFEDIADVDEERDVDADPGLELGGLGAALGGIAADPGVGLRDCEFYRGGALPAHGALPVHEEVAGGVLLEVVEGLA